MGFVNKVMLMGNTTCEPELRTLPSGTTVCDFVLATNRIYKTTSGEEKQDTVFIDCAAFGRTAEVIAEYCPKGRSLFVEGRLHYESWEDKTGTRRSKLSVIVESFQFVGSREGEAGGGGANTGPQRELPLDQRVQRMETPAQAPAAGSLSSPPMQRRATALAAGSPRREARFTNGQRPDIRPDGKNPAAARPARNQAGKAVRAPAAGGPNQNAGAPTATANPIDHAADKAQCVEEADLPF